MKKYSSIILEEEVENIKKHVFEGVIPNLIRRYKETESKAVKDALSKFMSVKSCLNCHGTRLNEAARHVFIKIRI